jgi:hypothetical protein
MKAVEGRNQLKSYWDTEESKIVFIIFIYRPKFLFLSFFIELFYLAIF